jgi:type IV secretory pathway TrbL component
LTNGWAAAATAVPSGPEPAVDALDIAASSVLLLMICWNAPKFTAGILGGTPAFTGGDAVGTAGALAQGALLAGAAVAGGVALGAKMLAAGGAMSAGQAAGMGAGGAGASGAGAAGSSVGGGGGNVAPPSSPSTASTTPSSGSNGGGTQGGTNSTPRQPQPPPEKTPDGKATQVAEKGKQVARGFATTTAFVRATQSAIPPDHAPQVAPPPLNTSGDAE